MESVVCQWKKAVAAMRFATNFPIFLHNKSELVPASVMLVCQRHTNLEHLLGEDKLYFQREVGTSVPLLLYPGSWVQVCQRSRMLL